MLDVPDLDTANRCATVTRKGSVRDVITWQPGQRVGCPGCSPGVEPDRCF
ncbi:hypothetical protein [Rhodococcus wratislaviensis]|nr:hypothetical protein [Rhodococcus wratislaviensis]